MAVSWIQEMGRDEIVDYLPQLVQALKHETYDSSPLAAFLLRRALCSPRVAHHLYWLLTQSLPGQCPQVSKNIKMILILSSGLVLIGYYCRTLLSQLVQTMLVFVRPATIGAFS